jgi:general secretion pathway protein A
VYIDFYGLTEKPFSTTPDPRFLHLTPRHREALAQLTYGIQENKGFVVLTGEVGTGKTTLLRALLDRLDPATAVAFVVNSSLPFDGLLEYVLEDFGAPEPGATLAQRLVALNRFLIDRRRAGQQALLLVDEAQNLSIEALEQIRLLSNCEIASDKLLQILLVGQPELDAKLGLPALRQLRQRIELRVGIAPLSSVETSDYIRTRLRVAGARDPEIFTDDARARITAATGGIPRLINILCDHCLLIGYADQKQRIGAAVVDEALEALRLPRRLQPAVLAGATSQSRATGRRLVVTLVAALSVGVAAVIGLPDDYRTALVRSMRDLLGP